MILSDILIKMPSQKEKISYKLVSLILHDGDSINCWHYASDVFDTSTGILWNCDNYEITEINNFTEGLYTRYSHKNIYKEESYVRLIQNNSNGLWLVLAQHVHFLYVCSHLRARQNRHNNLSKFSNYFKSLFVHYKVYSFNCVLG